MNVFKYFKNKPRSWYYSLGVVGMLRSLLTTFFIERPKCKKQEKNSSVCFKEEKSLVCIKNFSK